MARPAIVIGLGGTGQWVLTYLKRDLMEGNGGVVPSEVKLLSFDTTKHPSAYAGKMPTKGEEAAKVGTVSLEDKTEFIHYGVDTFDLFNSIKNGQYPYLSWSNATNFLNSLPRVSFQAQDGAGAIRHIGRLALFKNMQDAQGNIKGAINGAISQIKKTNMVNQESRLEIVLVGSCAGGTGASIFVDMGLIARHLAEANFPGNVIVRGIMVSPRVFTGATDGGDNNNVLARAFATWRELDRFKITNSQFGQNFVQYTNNNTFPVMHTNCPLFDGTYIVDPDRQLYPLPMGLGQGEQVLFPSIADFVSAILDETAGDTYSRQVINLGPSYLAAENKQQPLHCSFGTYTVRVPIFEEQQAFGLREAKLTLTEFLQPVSLDTIGTLADNMNLETQGKIGHPVVSEFFKMTQLIDQSNNSTVPSTAFIRLIGQCFEGQWRGEAKQKESDKKHLHCRDNSRHFSGITDITVAPNGTMLLNDIRKINTETFQKQFPQSLDLKQDPGTEGFPRITRGASTWPSSIVGQPVATGPLQRGKFGKQMEKIGYSQLAIFETLLGRWVEMNLNGRDVSARVSKSGKLGWMITTLKAMEDQIQYFCAYIQDVDGLRNSDGLLPRAERDMTEKYKIYDRDKSKGSWVDFVHNFRHPDAYEAERQYIQAVENLVETRKDTILLLEELETASMFRTLVENTRHELEAWGVSLTSGSQISIENRDGKTISVHQSGLMGQVLEKSNDAEQGYLKSRNVTAASTEKIVGGHDDYQPTTNDIEDNLKKIAWKVNSSKDQLINLADTSQVYVSKSLNIELSFNEVPMRKEISYGDDSNYRTFIKESMAHVRRLSLWKGISEQIQKDYPNGQNFAAAIVDRAEPLLREAPMSDGPRVLPGIPGNTGLLRMEKNLGVDPYVDEAVVPELNRLSTNTVVFTATSSKDIYKATLVRFADMIHSQDFDIWERCRKAYLHEAAIDPENGASKLHIFPAEIYACKYERKIMDCMQQNYRILHPEVVALLENEKKIELFFRAMALGFINLKQMAGGQPYYVFQIPGGKEIQLTQVADSFQGGNIQTNYFSLINQFVNLGCDIASNKQQVFDYHINFDALQQAFEETRLKLGKAETNKKYQKLISASDAMITDLRNRVALKRQQAQQQGKSGSAVDKIDVAEEDLANLGETILKLAIGHDTWPEKSVKASK